MINFPYMRLLNRLLYVCSALCGILFSQVVYSQGCDLVTSQESRIVPDGLCAPVDVSIFSVAYGMASIPAGTTFDVIYDWGDGSIETIAATIDYNVSPPTVSAATSYTYPARTDGNCTYEAIAYLSINGVKCTGSRQSQIITIWDEDDNNGGVLAIEPVLLEVCVGEEKNVTFTDVSVWNCTGGAIDKPNYQDRKVRWRYGTDGSSSNRISGIVLTKDDGSTVNDIPSNTTIGDLDDYHYITLGPTFPKNESWSVYIPATNSSDVGKVYEITLDNWNYCNPYNNSSPVSVTAQIIIIDKPTPEIVEVGGVCGNSELVILELVSGSAVGDGVWSGVGVSEPHSDPTFDPAIAGAGTHKIMYEETEGGCTGRDSIEITVYSAPEADFLSSSIAGCIPFTVTIDNSSTNGNSYNWTYGDGVQETTTDLSSVSHTYTVPGTYVLELEAVGAGCNDTKVQTINVYDKPVASFVPSKTSGCSPLTIDFANLSTGATEYFWDLDEDGNTNRTDVDLTYTFTDAGLIDKDLNIRLIAEASTGCRDTAFESITIHPLPQVDNLLGNPAGICFGGTVELDGNLLGDVAPYIHNWIGDITYLDNTNLSKANFSATDEGIFSVYYNVSDANGCSNNVRFDVEVAEVKASFPTDTMYICGGENIILMPEVTGGTGNYTSHLWTGSGVGNLNADNIQYPNFSSGVAGVFNLNYRVSDNTGCSIDEDLIVVVSDTPTSFAGNDSTICSLSLALAANNPVVGIGKWTKVSGPGNAIFADNSDEGTTVTVDKYGLYRYMWTVTNNTCVDFDFIDIRFTEMPSPNAGTDTEICGNVFTLTATPAIGNGTWSVVSAPSGGNAMFADATLAATDVNVNVDGIYVFQWTDDNGYGCIGTDDVEIIFNAVPVSQISISSTSGCSPLSVYYEDGSSGGSISVWDFGDGTIDTVSSPSSAGHTFINSSATDTSLFNATFTIISNEGCKASLDFEIKVYPEFSAGSISRFQGCSPVLFDFPAANPKCASVIWDFGDDSPLETGDFSPSHLFQNNGSSDTTYFIKLIGESPHGCADTVISTVTVFPQVDTDFSTTVTTGCSPLTIGFTNGSVNSDLYQWQLGDGMVSNERDPNHTYFNTADTVRNFDVRLIASSINGCADTIEKVINVSPAPTSNFSATYVPGCSPVSVDFTNNSSDAISYEWDFDDENVSTDENVSHDFYNDSTYVRYFQVTLNATNQFSCTDSSTREVTVYPTQDFDFTIDPDISCHPGIASIYATPGAYSYSWDFGNGNTLSGNKYSTIQTFNNTSDNDTIYEVSLIASSVFGCQDTTVKTITVNKDVTAELVLSEDKGCAPLAIAIQNLSSQDGAYYWDYGDGRKDTTAWAGTFNFTYDNVGTSPEVHNLKLIVELPGGCRDSVIYPVEVFPRFTAGFTADDTGCSPFPVQFTNTVSGLQYFEIDFGDGYPIETSNASPLHTFTAPYGRDTSYIVRQAVESQYGCVDTLLDTIYVKGTPLAQFKMSLTDTVASNKVVEFYNISEGGISHDYDLGGLFQYSSAVVDTISRQFPNPAVDPLDYEMQLIVEGSSGCKDTFIQTLWVLSTPVAGFDADSIGCSPFTVSFTDTTKRATEYFWDFGDGSPTKSERHPQHTFTTIADRDTSYWVMLTATSPYGETDKDSLEIKVKAVPVAKFDISTPPTCSPFIAEFTDLSINSDLQEWDMGDGNTYTDPGSSFNHTYSNASAYYKNFAVELTTSRSGTGWSCSSTARELITVSPDIIAGFDVDTIGCSPHVVVFDNTSVGASSFSWDFGDGSIQSSTINPIHAYTGLSGKDTTYNATLLVSSVNSCVDAVVKKITVRGVPDINLDYNSMEGCSPFEVTVEDQSSFSNSIYFDFGDGTQYSGLAGETVSHIYENAGNAPVYIDMKVLASTIHGCEDSVINRVSVLPDMEASFSTETLDCSPLRIQFNNNSSGTSTYEWDFGDGSPVKIEMNQTHDYSNSGNIGSTYNIELRAFSYFGCTDTARSAVVDEPALNIDFHLEGSKGCSPFIAEILNISEHGTKYSIDYGDGSFEEVVEDTLILHEYTNNGTTPVNYEIKLIVESPIGCKDSISKYIEVLPRVNAIIVSDDTGCSPLEISFGNSSIGARTYEWDFGDGSINSSSIEPFHLFENNSATDTIYNVQLKSYSPYGCTDSITKQINVYPGPKSEFFVDVLEGCTPFRATFDNSYESGSTYHWNLGDGNVFESGDTVFQHIYVNESVVMIQNSVSLSVSNQYGCSAVSNKDITIAPVVKAKFLTDTAGCSPFLPNIVNLSEGSHSYEWDFSDGYVTSSVTPVHTLISESDAGSTFDVTLIATSPYNCSDTARQEIDVYPIVPDFIMSENAGCNPLEVTFTNRSMPGLGYLWDFGDGITKNTTDSIINYIYTNLDAVPVKYKPSLTVSNGLGCTATIEDEVEVFVNAGADILPDRKEGCSPLEVKFSNFSLGASEYIWDFADGNVSSDFQPYHIFRNEGVTDTIYKVKLSVLSPKGCSDSATYDILVHASPEVDFEVTPIVQTYPDSDIDILNTTSPGPWDYTWEFGDNSSAIIGDVDNYSYQTYGEYIVELTGESDYCYSFSVQKILILPSLPYALFSPDTTGCPPLDVHFRNNSESGTSYIWDFGDGNFSTLKEPNHVYTDEGRYEVTLQALNDNNDVSLASSVVVVHPKTKAFFTPLPNRVKIPGQAVLFSNQSENAEHCVWDFGNGVSSNEYSPEYQYTTSGIYDVSLYIRSLQNCTDTFRLPKAVVAESHVRVKMPNAFTPGSEGSNGGDYVPGDRYNRVFYPVVASGDVVEYELQVFNRWGNLLFLTKDLSKGWDGYYNGKLCPQDVYVWRILCKFNDGVEVVDSGDITLLR